MQTFRIKMSGISEVIDLFMEQVKLSDQAQLKAAGSSEQMKYVIVFIRPLLHEVQAIHRYPPVLCTILTTGYTLNILHISLTQPLPSSFSIGVLHGVSRRALHPGDFVRCMLVLCTRVGCKRIAV